MSDSGKFLPQRDTIVFECENGHELNVYSSDPYYPDYAECQKCGELMERVETIESV
jgi:hypothetical protein